MTNVNMQIKSTVQSLDPSKNPPSFCIILPMYNEENSAKDCVFGIAEYLATLSHKTAIIAVDDGSVDKTREVLAELKKAVPNLLVEIHKQNGGYGAATRTGFNASLREGFDYALVMDADGTQDPCYIGNFLKPMADSYDFIKATRYSKGGKVLGVPFKRRLVSWLGNKLAKWMLRLPLSDYTNGFRAIHKSILTKLDTKERGFAILIEEVSIAKKLGARFIEVPYTLSVRKQEGSLSKFVYSLRVYKNYLQYLFQK